MLLGVYIMLFLHGVVTNSLVYMHIMLSLYREPFIFSPCGHTHILIDMGMCTCDESLISCDL